MVFVPLMTRPILNLAPQEVFTTKSAGKLSSLVDGRYKLWSPLGLMVPPALVSQLAREVSRSPAASLKLSRRVQYSTVQYSTVQ